MEMGAHEDESDIYLFIVVICFQVLREGVGSNASMSCVVVIRSYDESVLFPMCEL